MEFQFKFKAEFFVVCEVVEAVDTVFCAKISVIYCVVVNKFAGEADVLAVFLDIDVVNFCVDVFVFTCFNYNVVVCVLIVIDAFIKSCGHRVKSCC